MVRSTHLAQGQYVPHFHEADDQQQDVVGEHLQGRNGLAAWRVRAQGADVLLLFLHLWWRLDGMGWTEHECCVLPGNSVRWQEGERER